MILLLFFFIIVRSHTMLIFTTNMTLSSNKCSGSTLLQVLTDIHQITALDVYLTSIVGFNVLKKIFMYILYINIFKE